MVRIQKIMDSNSKLEISGMMSMLRYRGKEKQCLGLTGRQELSKDFAGKIFSVICFNIFNIFRYTINGVDAWGVSEWEYRHKEGNKNK